MESEELPQMLKSILEEISCQVVIINPDFTVYWANKKAREMVGLSLSEIKGRLCYDLDYVIFGDSSKFTYRHILDSKEELSRIVQDSYDQTWLVKWKPLPVMDEEKMPPIAIIAYNITETQEVENRLQRHQENFVQIKEQFQHTEEKFRSLFVHNPDAIFVLNLEGEIISANPAAVDIFGYKRANLENKSYSYFIPEEERPAAVRSFREALEGYPRHFECAVINGSEERLHIKAKLFPMIIKGEIKAVYGIVKDITEKKEIQSRLDDMTYYDHLTGLPNRNFLEEELNRLANEDRRFALLFIDLDRFQRVNESLGHSYGDRLLQQAASRLASGIDGDSIIARFSGDEFIIIVPDVDNYMEIKQIISHLLDSFSHPFEIKDNQIYLSFSVGVSFYPDDTRSEENLIKNADMAMNRAKMQGEASYSFYDSDLVREKVRITRKLNMEGELRRAIRENDFVLYYQPQINLHNGNIVGLEALLRWEHADYGMIPPGDFIPLAEETGLIKEIGSWVMGEACRQLSSWRKQGFGPQRVGVNVSIKQLRDRSFIDEVNQVLQEHELDSDCLEIEVTENIVRDLDEIEAVLSTLKSYGIRVAVDDFGTGYSSLNVLGNLPINTLKIDRTFIMDSTTNQKAEALVKTIIELGQNLDLDIVAEGVETDPQKNLLLSMDCPLAQGFLFSKPLPPAEIEKVLKADIVLI